MRIIEINEYGGNRNALKLTFLNYEFYFSYDTIVAFEDKYGDLYVSENVWSKTTGRHLNMIDGGDTGRRLKYEDFKKKLDKVQDNLEKVLQSDMMDEGV